MIMHKVVNYSASLVAILAAAAVGGGCSGAPQDDSVDNEHNSVTNKGAFDPGPRAGAAGAGAPLAAQPIQFDDPAEQTKASAACFPGLSAAAKTLCEQAVIRFQEIDSVSGMGVSTGIPGFIAAGTQETGVGLGPTFNNVGCHVCHSQPGVLGSGVGPTSPQFPGVPNPQVAVANLDGQTNALPSFITANGPIREARFVSNPDGTADGGVHGLFTIAGRADASGCNAQASDFATAVKNNNVIFRIPLPTFGDGLVELISEEDLENNLTTSQNQFHTGGTFNRSGNDGSITRFGWKAQNKSLTIFAMEAYNVEQGVSNLGFPDDREGGASNLAGCFGFNGYPEDNTNITGNGKNTVSDVSADVLNFAAAMELSAPPVQSTAGIPTSACDIAVFGSCANAATQGYNMFNNIGCVGCHTRNFTTAASSFDGAMSNFQFHPFSDFAIHHMGAGLSDRVTQGAAGPDQFRTAPLWGLGQRLFFLHDGRTSDLTTAIAAHGGDAAQVITNFNNLSQSNQQALLVFLRSL
jgi:CxxC motif-containing protein (DUF1111 family)